MGEAADANRDGDGVPTGVRLARLDASNSASKASDAPASSRRRGGAAARQHIAARRRVGWAPARAECVRSRARARRQLRPACAV